MTLPTLSFSSWTAIAASAAIIGTCWRTISAWVSRVGDLIVGRVILKDEAARAAMSLVWERGQRSPLGLRLFSGTTSFVFPKRRVEVVGFETISSDPLLFWMGRVPLLVASGFDEGHAKRPSVGNWSGDQHPVTIRYLRGTFDPDQFLADAIVAYNRLRQVQTETLKAGAGPRRFNVIRMHGSPGSLYSGASIKEADAPRSKADPTELLTQIQRKEVRLLTWTADDLIERSTDAKPFVNHPVDPLILAQLDRVGTWLKRETWYRSKGVPWRVGVLLWGKPGSGKDTIVRNVALQHDLPIYAFDLSSYDNRSFGEAWKQVQQNAPAIALISDIDAVFKGRENVAGKTQTHDNLTFDCLLNTISGVGSSEGVLLMVTTNRLETLDPALGIPDNGHGRSTRPGRIDLAIEVGAMREAQRRVLATLMLGDWPDQVEPAVAAGEGEMAAQFQERCAQLALRLIEEHGLAVEPDRVEHPAPEETHWANVEATRAKAKLEASYRAIHSLSS